jgi:hypothetical protein
VYVTEDGILPPRCFQRPNLVVTPQCGQLLPDCSFT